jgi:NAD(P)-dependent dehydrogenase (short-subunit alcohol dehydrogenase family)
VSSGLAGGTRWSDCLDVRSTSCVSECRSPTAAASATQWRPSSTTNTPAWTNLSSTSALGNRGQANYSTAKAGLQGFTKTLAVELGKLGVTANAIAPGFIETEMTKSTAERMGIPFERFTKGAASPISVARAGKPEDIAHLVSFFVSEGAGFVSGQVVYAAGGPTA